MEEIIEMSRVHYANLVQEIIINEGEKDVEKSKRMADIFLVVDKEEKIVEKKRIERREFWLKKKKENRGLPFK